MRVPWRRPAERVLLGELPHRDFDGMYSGGLELFHALAFKLFGTRLISLRMAIFVVFLPTVPLLYRMGRRLGGPISASVAVLLAVAWGLPNYTSAMPSWYNLFLAIYGTAALFEFMEDGRKPWLRAIHRSQDGGSVSTGGRPPDLDRARTAPGGQRGCGFGRGSAARPRVLRVRPGRSRPLRPPRPVDFRTAVGAFRLLPLRPASPRARRIRGGRGVRRQGARKGRKTFASILRLDGTARAGRGGSGTRAAAAVHRFRRPRVDLVRVDLPAALSVGRYSFAIRRRSRRCGPLVPVVGRRRSWCVG